MKHDKRPAFQLYPGSEAASRLSIAGGGARLLSVLMLVAAALCSAAALWAVLGMSAAWGLSGAVHYVLDEWEEMVPLLFVLWGGFAACRYASAVLQAKAELTARSGGERPAAQGAAEPAAAWDGEGKD